MEIVSRYKYGFVNETLLSDREKEIMRYKQGVDKYHDSTEYISKVSISETTHLTIYGNDSKGEYD